MLTSVRRRAARATEPDGSPGAEIVAVAALIDRLGGLDTDEAVLTAGIEAIAAATGWPAVHVAAADPAGDRPVPEALTVPLTAAGAPAGRLDVLVPPGSGVSRARDLVVRTVGAMVSQRLTRVVERVRQAEAAEDVAALETVLRCTAAATTEQEALGTALDAIRAGFGWAYGSFWALDADGGVLRFVQESGDVNAEFRAVTRTASFARGVGLSGRAWAREDLVFVEDLGELVDCVRAPAAQQAGVRSGVCFPIRVEGALVGTMDFFATRTLTLSDSRTSALRNTAQLVGLALERLRAATRVAGAARELRASLDGVQRDIADATHVAGEGQQLVLAADRQVSALGDASREISKVVHVITTIAAQTNLLALNATIEAARAGDAGRGFAVVAGEVKELATGTAAATTEVGGRVEAIQSQVGEVTAALADIRALVERLTATQTAIAGVLTEQVEVTRAILA